MSLKLTVNVVQDRLVSELKTVGFTLTSGPTVKLISKINAEAFLYLGVFRRGLYVRIDPVIGVDNLGCGNDSSHWMRSAGETERDVSVTCIWDCWTRGARST